MVQAFRLFWQLVHDLYAGESSWQCRCFGSIFAGDPGKDVISLKVDHASLDSTIANRRVLPDGAGAIEKAVFNLSANRVED